MDTSKYRFLLGEDNAEVKDAVQFEKKAEFHRELSL